VEEQLRKTNMIKRREQGHRNVVNPTITPLVGEHPWKKHLREAEENTKKIQAAQEREAAGTPLPEDSLVTGHRTLPPLEQTFPRKV
jgi:hypothetical protein